jgi:hypothetical protein
MITDTIGKQINEALKDKDELRLNTLRMLSSALHNAEIDKKREKLTEEDEMKVVKHEAKKRLDAIAIYEKAQDQEKVIPKIEREKQELEILNKFLPEEMSDEKLQEIVVESIKQLGAVSMTDMGKVMSTVMAKLQGKVGGDRVSSMVKAKLS